MTIDARYLALGSFLATCANSPATVTEAQQLFAAVTRDDPKGEALRAPHSAYQQLMRDCRFKVDLFDPQKVPAWRQKTDARMAELVGMGFPVGVTAQVSLAYFFMNEAVARWTENHVAGLRTLAGLNLPATRDEEAARESLKGALLALVSERFPDHDPELMESDIEALLDWFDALPDLKLTPETLEEIMSEFHATHRAFGCTAIYEDEVPIGYALLGTAPTAESFCRDVIGNLRSYRSLPDPAGLALYSRKRELTARLPDVAGNESTFYLGVLRGWGEMVHGLSLNIYEGRPGIDRVHGAHMAQVGLHLALPGRLSIVTVQGPSFDKFVHYSPFKDQPGSEARIKADFKERNDRFARTANGSSAIDLLMALAVQLGKRWGVSEIRGIRDGAQKARAKIADGAFYDLVFKRHGFEAPAPGDDYWRLDPANADDAYVATVLARSHRSKPKQWKTQGADPFHPQVRYFRDAVLPAFGETAWTDPTYTTDIVYAADFDARPLPPFGEAFDLVAAKANPK